MVQRFEGQSSLATIVAVSAFLLLVSGCSNDTPWSGGVPAGSALDLGTSPGTICLARGGSEPKTLGAIAITNIDDDAVTLTKISLAKAKGLEVVGTRVFPGEDKQLVADGWPPYGKKWRRQYKTGTDAVGTQIAAGDTISLWVGVNATSGAGTAAAARVEYETASGRLYWQDSVDAFIIRAEQGCE